MNVLFYRLILLLTTKWMKLRWLFRDDGMTYPLSWWSCCSNDCHWLIACAFHLFVRNGLKHQASFRKEEFGRGSCICQTYSISFTSVPTSPDFVVYGFLFQVCGEFIEISMWCPGEEEWTVLEFWPSIPFFPSSNNPVIFQGEFYFLGRKGELGVFNPELKTWDVLCKPEPIYLTEPFYGVEYCHLLELHGDLISVFRTDDTKAPIRVFKLNQSEMVWEKLEHLVGMTLFVDRRNSIAITPPEKKYANRIYVPRFEGGIYCKKGIYYSMEDNRYHPSMHRVVEPLACVWMEPKLHLHN